MAAGSGSRAVCRMAWAAIQERGPLTCQQIADTINRRKTRYGSPLKHTWEVGQVVQFMIRSPLFYPDPACLPTLRPGGKLYRDNPKWFAHPLEEVVKRLANKTHIRTPVKNHPKFLRDAIQEAVDNDEGN